MQILGIDHIGIAVNSIADAVDFYQRALGLKLDRTEAIPERHIRIGFIDTGSTQLELIEPTSNESVIAKFIASRGEGIHHFCLRVDDLAGALAVLKDQGYELIDPEPRQGAAGSRIAFVHPRAAGGVLIELKEVSR